MSTYKSTKPSKLEEFKLFYESVPVPDYLEGADTLKKDAPKPSGRSRKLTRKRK